MDAILNDAERSFIADEMTQLRDEINNISTRTKFNGQQLLNGSFGKALDTTSTVQGGFNLATSGTAAVTKVDITGAAAGTTFTFADANTGELTLSDGTNSQMIDITALNVAAGGVRTELQRTGRESQHPHHGCRDRREHRGRS